MTRKWTSNKWESEQQKIDSLPLNEELVMLKSSTTWTQFAQQEMKQVLKIDQPDYIGNTLPKIRVSWSGTKKTCVYEGAQLIIEYRPIEIYFKILILGWIDWISLRISVPSFEWFITHASDVHILHKNYYQHSNHLLFDLISPCM